MSVGSAFVQRARNAELLYESKGCDIYRDGDLVELMSFGQWRDEFLRAAQKHKVNSAHLSLSKTARFLADLPPLRRLHVTFHDPIDLSAIGQMTTLEYLGLMGPSAPQIDLSRLHRLTSAYVTLSPDATSLLNCPQLQALWLWNSELPPLKDIDFSNLPKLQELHITAWPKLRVIDLTAQPDLQALHLEALPKLETLRLHPDAHLRQLHIGGCGKYRIDWPRIGPDLRYLELTGPLRFPLEDILGAPNLEKLMINFVRKYPPLNFLLHLKNLQNFSHFESPPGPKFSDEDYTIIRQINARIPTPKR